jgi:hypothetical protein
MTIVIEHPAYIATRERLMKDDMVQIMCLELAAGVESDEIPMADLVNPNGSPTFRFINLANRTYRARCNRAGVVPDGGHVGAVAEAILMLWKRLREAGITWLPKIPQEQAS